MKRTTVNQWCLLCAATATIAAALTGCVEEGDKAPPQLGQQGPSRPVDAGAAGSTMGAAGSMMGAAGMGGMGSAGMGGMGAGGAAGGGMGGSNMGGSGGTGMGTNAAADAGTVADAG